MRCRRIVSYTDLNGDKRTAVVWFGSVGKTSKSGAIWNTSLWNFSKWGSVSENALVIDNRDNFDEKQNAVVSSLTQRLSVLKGELWYNISYGLPLLDKHKSKVAFDSFILSTITQHPDVSSVLSFTSTIRNKKYECEVKILSTYGEIELKL